MAQSRNGRDSSSRCYGNITEIVSTGLGYKRGNSECADFPDKTASASINPRTRAARDGAFIFLTHDKQLRYWYRGAVCRRSSLGTRGAILGPF